MAWVIPTNGPAKGAHESEVRLYNLFKQSLGNDYIVIHNIDRHMLNRKGNPDQGEIDFCIIHRGRGMIILEVKSGDVHYRPGTREWYYPKTSHSQEELLRKNPFRQARENSYAVADALKKNSLTSKHLANHRYRYGYAVWLPDTRWQHGNLQLQGEQWHILDKRDLKDPDNAILRIFDQLNFKFDYDPLTDDELLALTTVLEGHLDPAMVGILGKLGVDDTSPIVRLTPEQAAIRDELCKDKPGHPSIPAIRIPGPAGSGKTVVATSVAMIFASDFRREDGTRAVLYLVRNQHMADWLKFRTELVEEWLKEHPEESDDAEITYEPYDIYSLKELAHEVAKRGGLHAKRVNTLHEDTWSGQNELQRIIGENVDAMRMRGETMGYEVIIVDDAEDIEQMLWPPIRKLFRDPSTGRLRVFYDEAQRVDITSRFFMNIPMLQCERRLTKVMRNARLIFDKLTEFNPALRSHEFSGPEGFEITYIDPAQFTASERAGAPLDQALQNAYAAIFKAQPSIKAHEIAVISCQSQANTHWRTAASRNRKNQWDLTLRWIGEGLRDNHVTLSTIRSAKGLEFKAVILAEFDGISSEVKRDQILYVAISRANLQLVVLGTPADISLPQPSLWGRSIGEQTAPVAAS
jgi:hypothetical protein